MSVHAHDVLGYGHATLMAAFGELPDTAWEAPAVVGAWSAKDVAAHLVSFEQGLVELLTSLLEPGSPTPTLSAMARPDFNDTQVALRQHQSAPETLAEYERTFGQVQRLAEALPAERYRQAGLLAWYGAEYDLEDYLVYTYYGHKREHAAQLRLLTRRLAAAASARP